MFRFLIFLLVILGLGLLFAWMADNPGSIFLKWEWLAAQLGRPGEEVGIPLTLALIGMIGLLLIAIVVSSMLRGFFGIPSLVSKFFENRRRNRGYAALSKGLIAASSGDAAMARTFAKESKRFLEGDPLVALLGTQTALLEGNREEATANYKLMLQNNETRLVALRGLFLEAEKQGSAEAARHYAEEAAISSPSLPWAGNAKLRYQAVDSDWDSALETLEANRSAGLIDRDSAKRHRAVLLTASALSNEQAEPAVAKKQAREAHKLAKGLVPAATTFARVAARSGDIGGASKLLEACWKQNPHPELAEAYAVVRSGDSVLDRLKRIRKLAGLKPNHPEGQIALATAAIDANEWSEAREALSSILTSKPTRRACLLMAEIEEGEHGDKGRMRDWLSRAVNAPRDEAWIADGHVSDEWLPQSPITGELDAFEWKVPVTPLGVETAPVITLDDINAGPIEINEPVVADVEESKAEPVEDADVVDAEFEDISKAAEASNQKEDAEVVEERDDKPSAKDDTQETPASEDTGTEKIAANGSRFDGEETFETELPLKRRPDDPGPHPDKEAPKKGFKIF